MSDNSEQAKSWGLHVNEADRFAGLFYYSIDDLHSIPTQELQEIALSGLRERFENLKSKLPMLGKLADEQGVDQISDINDAAKLLFQHSIYKSYPVSFVEKSQFDRLTKWLSGFTTADLSGLNFDGVETIDDWIMMLDAQTTVRVLHSGGTSGKLSFLPRGTAETDLMVQGWRLLHEGSGPDVPPMDEVPVIFPAYRTGAFAQQRMFNRMVETVFGGDQSMLVALNDGRMSADALSLGGRLQLAAQKGELGEVRLSPALIARRDEYVRSMTEAPTRMSDFIDAVAKSLGGRPVAMLAWVGQLYDLAQAGLDRGLSNIFARNSNIMFGGGWKGRTPPENWEAVITGFLGVDKIRDGYGMTECIASARSCEHGHYHIYPFQIPFVLDPATGEPYPREGQQTGRFGVFDLGATTYWGGFLTGDKVTVSYEPCACGRTTPMVMANSISRYSEAEGGDDKINCAGAPEAHDNALAFLMASVED